MNKQRVTIITGASSGIGLACAERFAAEGKNLLLTARREQTLKLVALQLGKQYKVTVHELYQDVRERSSGPQLAHYIQRNQLMPEILINNAGLAVGLEPIQEGLIDDWEQMIDTNVKGLLYMSRSIAPLMIEQGFGHIINIGSIAGKETYPNGNVYCATKFAVEGLTKAMRMDLLPHGIKVTNLAPGAVETEFSLVRFKGNTERAANVYKGFVPLSPADVADAAWYCASLPQHVSIHEMLIMPTAQASASMINRNNS